MITIDQIKIWLVDAIARNDHQEIRDIAYLLRVHIEERNTGKLRVLKTIRDISAELHRLGQEEDNGK